MCPSNAQTDLGPPRLEHDIVIVTRNRPEALRMSIPLLLKQTRPPARLIIVDSSDDHESVRKAVEECARGAAFPIEVIRSAKGMTYQRSVGLKSVRSPIVLYPDDDSLFYPDTSEGILRVYECDTEGLIGGVCARPTNRSPLSEAEIRAAGDPARVRMTRWDRCKNFMGYRWTRLMNRIAPDPFMVHGREMMRKITYPTWLADENAVPVEWMTGFRMSFRTDVLREVGFEDAFTNYGGFEDASVCFRILERKALVGAHDAHIFHHRFPSKRSHGVGMGMRQVLNKAFIVCRHSPPGSEARRSLRAFARLKLAQYATIAHTKFGRELVLGAWRASGKIDLLDRCPPERLVETYRAARADCLRGYPDV
jgi:glycosyltransferase involved in cell wall biosynthesis